MKTVKLPTFKTLTLGLLIIFAFSACFETDIKTDTNTSTEETEGTPTIEANTTEEEETNSTTPSVTLSSLTLTVEKTSLDKDENTTVSVLATYSDNSTQILEDNIEWVVVPVGALQMQGKRLKASKDGNI
ncbi:MAG: hypothetical protein DRQ78_13370, partial [Epsilonproteobacteria bacterium]